MGLNPGSAIVPGDVPGRTSRTKSMILAVEAIVVLVVVAFVARSLWSNAAPPPQSTIAIPQRIAGFALQKAVTGQQAVNDFNKLHGKDVGAVSGWVGYYEGKSIVWASETSNEPQAYQLVDAMTRRIRAGNDMFVNLESFRIADKVIFTVVGQGQRHYYYQRGNRVIWIAAPRVAERAFLEDALKQIN